MQNTDLYHLSVWNNIGLFINGMIYANISGEECKILSLPSVEYFNKDILKLLRDNSYFDAFDGEDNDIVYDRSVVDGVETEYKFAASKYETCMRSILQRRQDLKEYFNQ